MTARARPEILAGIAFMVVGASLLPVMNTFAKSLAAEYPLWQVVWARFCGHLIWLSLAFLPRHGLSLLRARNPRAQWGRSLVFFASNACFIGALPVVPLATATTIMFTTPLIVTVLSVPLLGERVGLWRSSAVGVGFVGALIILSAGSPTGVSGPAGKAGGADAALGEGTGALLVLASALCFALYQILTRRLSSDDLPATQAVYTALAGAAITTCILPWVAVAPASGEHLLAFVGVGLVGGVAQLCVVQALQRGPASVISPIGYVELVSAAILGYAVFGDLPRPAVWYGALLIVAAGLLVAYRESRRGG